MPACLCDVSELYIILNSLYVLGFGGSSRPNQLDPPAAGWYFKVPFLRKPISSVLYYFSVKDCFPIIGLQSTWYLVIASAQFHRMTPSLGQLPPWSSWYPQVRMSLARVCSTDIWPLSRHFSLIFQIYISRSLRHVFSRSLMQPTSREWGPQAFHHSHWAIRLLGLKSGKCKVGNCIYMHLRLHFESRGKHI